MTTGDGARGAAVARLASAAVGAAAISALAVAPAGALTASLDGTTGLIGVRSAELQVTGVLSASIGAHYYESTDLSAILGCDPGRYVSLHLAASYGVTPWLEAALDLFPYQRGQPRRQLQVSGLDPARQTAAVSGRQRAASHHATPLERRQRRANRHRSQIVRGDVLDRAPETPHRRPHRTNRHNVLQFHSNLRRVSTRCTALRPPGSLAR